MVFLDNTPPLLSCPQSYVIELVDRQDSHSVNFNETRLRVNASDASGSVHLQFIPDKATITIGSFENVTVIATDRFGNKASCYFQVCIFNSSVHIILKKQSLLLGGGSSNALRRLGTKAPCKWSPELFARG